MYRILLSLFVEIACHLGLGSRESLINLEGCILIDDDAVNVEALKPFHLMNCAVIII